jgi:type VI secretion system protein ImpC
MRTLLHSVIASMIDPQRPGLVSWASRAMPRLPEPVRDAQEGQMMTFGINLRLDSALDTPHTATDQPLPQWASWLTPSDLPTVKFRVRLLAGAVDFKLALPADSHTINVPKTDPMLIEVSWSIKNRRKTRRVRLDPDEISLVDIAPRVHIAHCHLDSHDLGSLKDILEETLGTGRVSVSHYAAVTEKGKERSSIAEIQSADVVLMAVGSEGPRFVQRPRKDRVPRSEGAINAELLAALRSDCLIIPILFKDADMANMNSLPGELTKIAALQAIPFNLSRQPFIKALFSVLVRDIRLKTVLGERYRLAPKFTTVSDTQRVRITYEVERNGAVKEIELPFVVGVLGNFRGHTETTETIAPERFLEIDSVNFNQVMGRLSPRLSLLVDDWAEGDDHAEMVRIELKFSELEDFTPWAVLNQIETLRKSIKQRQMLSELHQALIDNPDFEKAVDHIIQEKRQPPYKQQQRSMMLAEEDLAKPTFKTTRGHDGSIYAVAFSPDNRTLISAAHDRLLKLWDVKTGREVSVFEGHENPVYALAIYPDGTKVVSGSSSGNIAIWDIASGQKTSSFKAHRGAITSIAISPDGKRIVSGSEGRTVKIWELKSGRELHTLLGHASAVNSIAISPEGLRVFSAGDRTIRLWDIESGEKINILKYHAFVSAIAVSLDGTKLVSGSTAGKIKLWDLGQNRELYTIQGHRSWIKNVVITPDGDFFATGARSGNIKLWDLKSGDAVHRFKNQGSSIEALAISSDGTDMASGTKDGTLTYWDIENLHSFDIISAIEQKPELSNQTRLKNNLLKFFRSLKERVKKNIRILISERLDQIEKQLSTVVRRVLHHPDFQHLEANWRGLKYILDHTDPWQDQKVKVLHIKKSELSASVGSSSDYNHSELYRELEQNTFGTIDGELFSLLVGSYEYGNDSDDFESLKNMAEIAERIRAPFIAAAAPQLFGVNNYAVLGNAEMGGEPPGLMDDAGWQDLRQNPASRFLGMTLPHMLLRQPYGDATNPVTEFDFNESIGEDTQQKLLWGNAAFAFACRIMDSVAKYGWFAKFHGISGGGIVEDLPHYTYISTDGNVTMKSPTDLPIPDAMEMALTEKGFLPLVHRKGTDMACFTQDRALFFSESRLNKRSAELYADEHLSYIMAGARFAQYLSVIVRDKVGVWTSANEIEKWLDKWIAAYSIENQPSQSEASEDRPLLEAHLTVENTIESPGGILKGYIGHLNIQPAYQFAPIEGPMKFIVQS